MREDECDSCPTVYVIRQDGLTATKALRGWGYERLIIGLTGG